MHQDVPESTVTNDNATLQFARINQRIDVFFANMEKRLAERFKDVNLQFDWVNRRLDEMAKSTADRFERIEWRL